MPGEPIAIEWKPSEDGGWDADIHILSFHIEGDDDGDGPPFTLTVHWMDDYTTEFCDSFEDGKRMAKDIARKILADALEGVEASEPAAAEQEGA